MKHFEIRVTGRVQQAGYRNIVQEAAVDLGFTGYVENMPDLSVRIVCEGPEEKLEDFLKRIRITNRLLHVKDITVEESDATGEFEYFEIKRGDVTAELGERLDTAIVLFKDMNERMDRGFTEVKEAVGEVKEEVHEVKDAVSEVKEEVHEVKKAISDVKEEVHEVKKAVSEVKDEVHEVKKAVSEVKEEVHEVKKAISDVKEEVHEVKEAVSGVKEEVSDMHTSMDEHFGRLDGKYHTISGELARIRKAIVKGLNIDEEDIEDEESKSEE